MAAVLVCVVFAALAGASVVFRSYWREGVRQQTMDDARETIVKVKHRPAEENVTDLKDAAGHLDPASRDGRERFWAVAVRVFLGWNHHVRGRDEDARADFTRAIERMEQPLAADSSTYRPWLRLLLYVSYASRAKMYESAARRRLPEATTRSAAQMPDVQVVAPGAADFARSFLDLDRAVDVYQNSSGKALVPGARIDDSVFYARSARNLILALTRFYLIKGLHERGHWQEALAVAELLDRSPSLIAGEPHYDVACVFAVAYARAGEDRYAEAAVRHLRLAAVLGFGKDPEQKKLGTIRRPFPQQLAPGADADLDGLRQHPAFLAFLREVNAITPHK